MRIHTDEAWKIASHFSGVLASDTRTLAAMIDDLVDAKIEQAARSGYVVCAETRHVKLGDKVRENILSLQNQST